ncbi:hypothetical protein [Sphingobacterium corticibacterium]|uniref:Uncharacterized protein n=1 Tax=Sphingobacterium corticibacterium TaxID=2484746 RepID=A0A4Q6XPG4_9SPHI|nr:hypothetical protein [Sphingobacterium corticibacterium]RZF59282.1 hypothetical protein EWE74_08820 [Sphingobacterium corticibacterium]
MYISLLVAVLIQSTSSMWIFVGFQLNWDYIESQLCINRFDTIPVCKGSCYLEEKIKEDQQHNDAPVKLKLLEVTMILAFFTLNNTQPIQKDIGNLLTQSVATAPLSDGFCFSIFKPPIA